MEKDYLETRGSIAHGWKTHCKKMREQWKVPVAYATFRHRVVDFGWDLNTAIHTPARKYRREKKWLLYNIIYRVKKILHLN